MTFREQGDGTALKKALFLRQCLQSHHRHLRGGKSPRSHRRRGRFRSPSAPRSPLILRLPKRSFLCASAADLRRHGIVWRGTRSTHHCTSLCLPAGRVPRPRHLHEDGHGGSSTRSTPPRSAGTWSGRPGPCGGGYGCCKRCFTVSRRVIMESWTRATASASTEDAVRRVGGEVESVRGCATDQHSGHAAPQTGGPPRPAGAVAPREGARGRSRVPALDAVPHGREAGQAQRAHEAADHRPGRGTGGAAGGGRGRRGGQGPSDGGRVRGKATGSAGREGRGGPPPSYGPLPRQSKGSSQA